MKNTVSNNKVTSIMMLGLLSQTLDLSAGPAFSKAVQDAAQKGADATPNQTIACTAIAIGTTLAVSYMGSSILTAHQEHAQAQDFLNRYAAELDAKATKLVAPQVQAQAGAGDELNDQDAQPAADVDVESVSDSDEDSEDAN